VNRNGKVEIDQNTATLVFQRYLQHSPERVWRALTSADELAEWYMAEATIDGRPGGSIDMVAGPARFHWTGKILTWQPFSLLEYEFNTPPHEFLPTGEESIIRFELKPVNDGTELTLTHSRLTKTTALGFAPGTHALLDRLEAKLDGTPLPDFMARYEEVKSGYPSWSPQA
jgi:uncharacterized protein YndB with AHSA1/START domain